MHEEQKCGHDVECDGGITRKRHHDVEQQNQPYKTNRRFR
ncbi:Uncharacterised protein [Vibrio cholerae]|nr:Uncharacterised protein [Vibrio cholerae]CSD25521.1 Uncharacterised protein [Vibrio cholerae]CSI96839.1 Uncharacterised protein [Vibrio cholerae]